MSTNLTSLGYVHKNNVEAISITVQTSEAFIATRPYIKSGAVFNVNENCGTRKKNLRVYIGSHT